MLLFYGFGYSQFERPNGAKYAKFNIFSVPARSEEEAKSMILMENGLAIRTITDKLIRVDCDVKQVSADDLAIVMWAAVDGNRETFLTDIITRFLKMGADVDKLRGVVEGAILDYEDQEGIHGEQDGQ